MKDFPLTISQVKDILNDNYDIIDMDEYQDLYEYYLPEMPYGTAKARTGDPANWIFDRLEQEFHNLKDI